MFSGVGGVAHLIGQTEETMEPCVTKRKDHNILNISSPYHF